MSNSRLGRHELSRAPLGLDAHNVDREGAQGVEAPLLPMYARLANESYLVPLFEAETLRTVDPCDEALEARRVHELEILKIDDHLARVVFASVFVDAG